MCMHSRHDITVCLQWAEEVKQLEVVICLDSAATVQSLKSGQTVREDLLTEFYVMLLNLQQFGPDVHFWWVPAHVGIEGNEMAQKLAKSAVNKNDNDILEIRTGQSEAKSIILDGIITSWQDMWDKDTKGRDYFRIQKSVRVRRFRSKSRKEAVTLSR